MKRKRKKETYRKWRALTPARVHRCRKVGCQMEKKIWHVKLKSLWRFMPEAIPLHRRAWKEKSMNLRATNRTDHGAQHALRQSNVFVSNTEDLNT